jgi:hypothetical protein
MKRLSKESQKEGDLVKKWGHLLYQPTTSSSNGDNTKQYQTKPVQPENRKASPVSPPKLAQIHCSKEKKTVLSPEKTGQINKILASFLTPQQPVNKSSVPSIQTQPQPQPKPQPQSKPKQASLDTTKVMASSNNSNNQSLNSSLNKSLIANNKTPVKQEKQQPESSDSSKATSKPSTWSPSSSKPLSSSKTVSTVIFILFKVFNRLFKRFLQKH